MLLENDNILVEELTDNIKIGGIITRHDYDSPYMFCKILLISDESRESLAILNTEDTVLVIKRYAKEEFIDNTFFIGSKDVRIVLDRNSYNKIREEGLEWIRKQNN